MRIYTNCGPLYYTKGIHANKKKYVWIFRKFEEAQKKGQELVFQGYKKVSVGRVKE